MIRAGKVAPSYKVLGSSLWGTQVKPGGSYPLASKPETILMYLGIQKVSTSRLYALQLSKHQRM